MAKKSCIKRAITPRVYLVMQQDGHTPFGMGDLESLFQELACRSGNKPCCIFPIHEKMFDYALRQLGERTDCLKIYSLNKNNIRHPENYKYNLAVPYGEVVLHESAPALISTAEILPKDPDEYIRAIVISAGSSRIADKAAKDLGLPINKELSQSEDSLG